jgi:hypothetical protein
MTRFVQVMLVLLVSLSLTACGGGDAGTGNIPAPSGNASATINWTAPTTREDGSAIVTSELGGYKIYYGTSSSNLSGVVNVMSPLQFTYQFNTLVSGTVYYFRVTAYDTNNSESQRSNMVTRTAS